MSHKTTLFIILSTLLIALSLPGCTARATAETTSPSHTAAPAQAITCTYYVATGGDDDDPGSQSQPWATFQHAAESAVSGETVCFSGGAYALDEPVHLSASGSAGAAITFIALPGATPLLDGGDAISGVLVFDQHTSHVRISGFHLRGFTIWGVELSGENRYVQLDHLEIEGGEASIRFTYGESNESPPSEGPVEHITLEDSTIHGSMYSAVDCSPGPCNHMVVRRVEIYNTGQQGESFYGSDGLEFARGYPVLVEDCYVHDNGGDGIDLNSRDRKGNATGVVVRRNRVVRNHLNGIKLWAGGRMENNLIWGQGNSAVWAGTFSSTLELFNNTVAYNMWDTSYSERNWAVVVGYPEELARPAVTLTLVNNIFAFNADPTDGGPTGVYLGVGVDLSEGHNLYYSRADGEITAEFVYGRDPDFTRAEIADGTWASYSGQGQADLTGDPRFSAGWPAVDLHLEEDSPAAGAGTATGAPSDDVDGRPRGDPPDLGAYAGWEATAWVYLPLVLRGTG
jgi:hypothetical protein